MNTSPNVLDRLKLLRFGGIDPFFNQICITVSRKVTIRKFKLPYYGNGRRHGTGNLKKGFISRSFPTSFYSDFGFRIYDVAVKTIYRFLSSLEWGPEGGPVGGPVFTVPAQDLSKSPFNSTQA